MHNSTDDNQPSPLDIGSPFQLLTEEEFARFAQIAPRTARKWRANGRGPRFIKMGHKTLYQASDVWAWVAAGGTRPHSEGK